MHFEETNMDARKLLDALVGASSVPNDSKVARPDPIQDMLAMFGLLAVASG